ncbi:ribosomal maturation YjgA family protein [Algoriella sp.]|uniref:ribosomal maturation YjgA family protein n=1 Tax=Algoriella sp. TaxID=1872434 RepID=UPI002FC6AACD
MFKFDKKSFIIAIIIFLVEVFIALFIKDKIIRPFIGDILVVIFIYYFLKAFINTKAINLAIFTLIFSFVVEILQYFNFVELIGLGHNKAARIIIGTSFSWIDLVCYFVGFIILFFIDKDLKKNKL